MRIAALALALLGTAAQAGEPPSVADRYANATRLIYPKFLTMVKNNIVVPHWIGDSDRFWYLRQTATGGEFVTVDAATGARAPAFDAAGVARSLAALMKTDVAADKLPFRAIDFSGSDVTFSVKGDRYRCAIATSACAAAGKDPAPEWLVSPDGKTAALARDGNVWLHDLATGKETPLTSDATADVTWGVAPAPSDFHALAGKPHALFQTLWSPDSKRLIVPQVDLTGTPAYPFVEYVPQDGSFRPKAHSIRLHLAGEKPPGIAFYSFDVASAARTRLDVPAGRIEMIDAFKSARGWRPDGHLLMFAQTDNLTAATLFDVDLVSGETREVIREPGVFPALMNAGGYNAPNVAVIAGGRQFLWSSQRSGWPQLYRYDVASGRLINAVTSGNWVMRDIVRIDEAHGQVYFVGSGREGGNPYYRSLYRVGLDGKGLTRLTPEAGDKPMINPNTGFGFDGVPAYQPVSPSGRHIVYNLAPIDTPTTTLLRRTDGTGAPIIVEKADASALYATGYKPPSEFTAKAADGKSDLYGVIYRPLDYDPQRKYPVILGQYNSPTTTSTPRYFGHAATAVIDFAPASAITQLGFIVVMLDPRGTPYRGAAFSNPPPGFLADMGLKDQVAALRQLGATDASMDMDRIGIMGASFGGWTVLRAMLNYPQIFKVGTAWAAPGAFYNMYDAPGLSGSDSMPTYAGGSLLRTTPSEKPANWAAMDSIGQVGRLQGKLLMGVGGMDENVLPGSTLQFYDAAVKANKQVELMFMPNSTHGPRDYIPYVTRHSWDFMVRNLAGVTPPDAFPDSK